MCLDSACPNRIQSGLEIVSRIIEAWAETVNKSRATVTLEVDILLQKWTQVSARIRNSANLFEGLRKYTEVKGEHHEQSRNAAGAGF